jgi:hypothetical protein
MSIKILPVISVAPYEQTEAIKLDWNAGVVGSSGVNNRGYMICLSMYSLFKGAIKFSFFTSEL